MDKHLNLFRFYSESDNNLLIENNLTRALALCLKHEPVFAHVFLSNIIDDFTSQCSQVTQDNFNISIDLQLRSKSINTNVDGINRIYAASLTTNLLSTEGFMSLEGRTTNDPVADLVIQFNDVLIICEVKRTAEDCRAQLKNQVDVLLKTNQTPPPDVKYISLTWEKVITFLETSLAFNKDMQDYLIANFYDFLLEDYPEWFPIRRLDTISYPEREKDASWVRIRKRLDILHVLINKKINNNYENSKSIPIENSWAREFRLGIGYGHIQKENKYITLNTWPGDTKAQGRKLFAKENKNWAWLKRHGATIDVNGTNGQILIEPYIKLAHFNSQISGIWNIDNAYDVFTLENFQKLTGKWQKEQWDEMDRLMTELFGSDWKTKSNWEERFQNSNRNYVVVNMAACVTVAFKYSEVSALDQNDSNLVELFLLAMNKVISMIEA